MSALYWFALILGAGLLLMSLFGDLFGHGDGPDLVSDGHPHGDAEGFRILSMRNATYFLFAFGASGLLLALALDGMHPAVRALIATALGVLAGAISATVFGWVGRTESGYMADDSGWVGRIGQVVLPISELGMGKILVNRNGRDHELLARPFDSTPDSPEEWRSVIIVDLENGVARVSPMTSTLDSPGTLSITPSTEP